MIHVQPKLYHVVFWETEDRSTSGGLRMQFDTLGAALAAFEEHQRHGQYRTGILMESQKISGVWKLIDRFPR
ncbi:hypothetical protein [Devosia sp. RR2S18]|uniref:hypothetical protein n=1 Tax=Devosia rhizosphaerae TaxID=3049774 RepID=UPI0025407B5B|nr:hypothetical protein [Devosia sp. RR2S18]WIJ26993.1 hypothetical protein QOV41_09705 [Devosia sp. RR2S18]